MAGTHEKPTPDHLTTFLEGYRSLTLDPSPRLRQIREGMSRPPEATIENAWQVVGKAILRAMRSVAQTTDVVR